MSEASIAAPEAAPVVPSVPVPAEAPAEAASSDQDAPVKADDTAENESEEKPKPRRPASERISELYARTKAAERERDAAFAEIERLRKPVVTPEQFEGMSYEQQQAVQVRHAVRQERAEELAAEARSREDDAARSRTEMFLQRVQEAQETIPDLMKVLQDDSLPVSPVASRFITESEKGPQVAYWLAQNRAEANRIARLDPYTQAYELGRIEQRITAAPSARKVSQAPAPVPKVGGSANTGAKDPGSMSMSEYIEWRNKRQ